MISAILLVIITVFIPPLGVFLIKGCGADVLINICLTILGYFPGHIHAFWLEYKHFKALEQRDYVGAPSGYAGAPPPANQGYGTIPQRV